MKPGDLIEWFYRCDDCAVLVNEQLWSSTMRDWVPICGVNLLIGTADGTLTWLHSTGGMYRARTDDEIAREPGDVATRVLHARVDDQLASPGSSEDFRVMARSRHSGTSF
jgi:hypothetical protein